MPALSAFDVAALPAAPRPVPTTAPGVDTTAARAKIAKTSKDFEAQFVSAMLGQMFEGVQTSAPFGGGKGETAFRSFLTDAMAKSLVRHGGVGVSKAVAAEMLKMQGLKP